MLCISPLSPFVQELGMFDSSRSAGHLVSRAGRCFAKDADRRLKPLGLSPGYIPVLFALSAEPVLSQKAIVQRAAIEQPTMAATLVRMERDGLVARQSDQVDGRAHLFRLTPLAKSKPPLFFEALDRGNAEALVGLSQAEKNQFMNVLMRIIHNLGGRAAHQFLKSDDTGSTGKAENRQTPTARTVGRMSPRHRAR
jgi:MarR family transcriptional regulator, transcriptional regulator for hemolysin